MIKAIITYFAPRFGFVSIPPRHAFKLLAETPIGDLTPFGLAKLPHYKKRREEINAMWRAIDAVKDLDK